MNDITKIIDGNPIFAMNDQQSHDEILRLLRQHQQRLADLPIDASDLDRVRVELDIAEALLGLQRTQEAWDSARATFDRCVGLEAWQEAATIRECWDRQRYVCPRTRRRHGRNGCRD